MKHPTLYASLLLIAGLAMPATAARYLTVSSPGIDDEVFEVTDGLVLDFATKPGFMVVKGGSATESTFAISDATVLNFSNTTGLSDIFASDKSVALRQNPVGDLLEFTAAPETDCKLSIYSLHGTTLLSVDDWHGENVDVSSLTPGLYIVNFNNQSIKFYKQ